MIVVRDRIGNVGELCFEPGLRALDEAFSDIAEFPGVAIRTVLEDPLARLEHQVQAGEVRILGLENIDNPQ